MSMGVVAPWYCFGATRRRVSSYFCLLDPVWSIRIAYTRSAYDSGQSRFNLQCIRALCKIASPVAGTVTSMSRSLPKQGRLSNHIYVHVLWMAASYTLFITITYDTRTLFFLLWIPTLDISLPTWMIA